MRINLTYCINFCRSSCRITRIQFYDELCYKITINGLILYKMLMLAYSIITHAYIQRKLPFPQSQSEVHNFSCIFHLHVEHHEPFHFELISNGFCIYIQRLAKLQLRFQQRLKHAPKHPPIDLQPLVALPRVWGFTFLR